MARHFVKDKHIRISAEERGNHLTNRCVTTDVRQKGFYLKAWRAECEFDIDYKGSHDVQLHVDSLGSNPSGSLEIDIILDKAPKSNIFTYDIQTSNLVYYYQGELSAQDVKEGATRDENVVGSYAVYHRNRRHNYIKNDGTYLNYGTGKAFHIYRPKAIDSKGVEVWCDLFVDIENSILEVTVPRAFLKTAQYPVTVDPSFGFTTDGGSERSVDGARTDANFIDTYTASSGDILTELHLWCRVYSGTETARLGVYDVSGGEPNNLLLGNQAVSVSNTSPADHSITGLSTALSAGTEYCLAMGPPDGTVRYRYENTGDLSDAMMRDTGSFPDPFVAEEGENEIRRVSIYAVYTEGGGSTTIGSDAFISIEMLSNARLGEIGTASITSDAFISIEIESNAEIGSSLLSTIGSDAFISTTITSDAEIQSFTESTRIYSNAQITRETINSDAQISGRSTLLSDSAIISLTAAAVHQQVSQGTDDVTRFI